MSPSRAAWKARRALRAGLVLVAAGGALPAAAHATYLAPVPVSATTDQEFVSASDPAISADGTWVAFQGSYDNETGLWRRNVSTGEVDLVAGGTDAADATGPSISADGEYIAFTSTADDLDPGAEPIGDFGCPEVYVRDMDIAPGSPGAYTLVSALDGSSTGILFNSGFGCPGPQSSGQFGVGGAQAAPGVAISADGNEVAFTVDSPSNLGPGGTQVDASQVVVRDLDTQTTTLVSVTPSGQATPGGGAYPSTESLLLRDGSAGEAGAAYENVPASTAAISADGSTVAWMGTNVPSQVPSATDVTVGMSSVSAVPVSDAADPANLEVEPLWRRISDGPSAPTERLLANAGLDFYDYTNYLQDVEVNPPAIFGGAEEEGSPGVPSLSADGDEVAVTADAPSPSALPALTENSGTYQTALPHDLYLVDMSNAAAPQVTPLTQVSNYLATGAATGSVTNVAMSPDGSEVAFETARTQFSLALPSLISPPIPDSLYAETYVVDVPVQTLELATSTYNGDPPDGNSGLLSVDGAGDVAVDSNANNLFYGYVNTNPTNTVSPSLGEIYVMDRVPPATAVASGSLTPPLAPAPRTVITRTLSANASSRRDGTVVVRARVPGAGKLSVRASAQLPMAGRNVARSKIPYRTVATARRSAPRATVVRVVVRIDRRDRRFAEARHGLYAHLRLRFSAAGHGPLRQSIPVTFRLRRSRHRRTR